MNHQSTGLLTWETVQRSAQDVKTMAQSGYLLEANIVLQDASGTIIRAAKYEVAADASTLTARGPACQLTITVIACDLSSSADCNIRKRWPSGATS